MTIENPDFLPPVISTKIEYFEKSLEKFLTELKEEKRYKEEKSRAYLFPAISVSLNIILVLINAFLKKVEISF